MDKCDEQANKQTSTHKKQQHGRRELHMDEQQNIQRERDQADTLERPIKRR
jgi:hypothetical protein